MGKRTIGMWLYENSGGAEIAKRIITLLKEREIDVINNVNLRNAFSKNGQIIYGEGNLILDELDLFFSYNAGDQKKYQVDLYQTLNRVIPMINSYHAFELTENKFQTSFVLRQNGIETPDYKFCHSGDTDKLKSIIKEWDKMVYKPTNGWGGMGLVKIENEDSLNMILPFLNETNLRQFYVERFIKYDNTDFRVDIVDGKFVGCYGRKANGRDWRTNISSGGSVFLREANDKIIELAKKACKVTGVDIGGVDIIYDREKEEYVVLEVNGISAFATPEQEEMGLDFNDKKIKLIVDLIDRKTKK
jgi:ribosomal protein S6--L-glutamate ligase